jgi:hypothetical protein
MTKKKPVRKFAARDESPVKRIYLKQLDVPAASLDDALRVPQAILDHYAGKPTSPLYVAKALNVDPKGSQLKVLTGAAIAFGLIDGGAQAATISVTDLARRILRPKEEGVDHVARREAVLKPRVFGEFLRNYDEHPFPRQDIALNVLEGMEVPRDKAAEVLDRIQTSAASVGFLEEIKGKMYVSLHGAGVAAPMPSSEAGDEIVAPPLAAAEDEPEPIAPPPAATVARRVVPATGPSVTSLAIAIADDERRRRVFVTHGKNRDLVEPIKRLLDFGEMVPVVSVERTSVSKPVPEKVMDDMRGCGAAIIHVDADQTIVDGVGAEHVIVNPNVLIEIGAAMAFYGRRFILLVRDGVKLPSNLQGLFEVRYSADTLDAVATIKLLEAIKDIKNYGLPTDPPAGDS